MRGIHRSPVDSPHKGQWRGGLMLFLICDWTNGPADNRDTGDLRRLANQNIPICIVTTIKISIIGMSRVKPDFYLRMTRVINTRNELASSWISFMASTVEFTGVTLTSFCHQRVKWHAVISFPIDDWRIKMMVFLNAEDFSIRNVLWCDFQYQIHNQFFSQHIEAGTNRSTFRWRNFLLTS